MPLKDAIKYQIKIKNKTEFIWAHFCYIPQEIRDKFSEGNYRGWMNNDWVEKWSREDFGISQIYKPEKFKALREAIREAYKQRYPELYIESDNDNQGWTRWWVIKKMKEEMGNSEWKKKSRR
jgi:hypothetical protein